MPSSDGDTLEGIKRKDFERLLITCTNPPDDAPRDITSDALFFEARTKDTGETILISKSIGDGITKIDAANGEAEITIFPTDTQQFTKKVTLDCQLTMVDANSRPSTINFKLPVLYRR